jgi:hypothetical protein
LAKVLERHRSRVDSFQKENPQRLVKPIRTYEELVQDMQWHDNLKTEFRRARGGGLSDGEFQRNIEKTLAEMDWEPLHTVSAEYRTAFNSSPRQPARVLFAAEWLIKTAPKASESAHVLGGALAQPVACVHCGDKSHLMARIDLADPGLPETLLGRGKLPVFWCLDCGEWESTFFDLSDSVPVPLVAPGRAAVTDGSGHSHDDLPEKRVALVPVPVGKRAGRKSKLGGKPTWIQNEETPECPKCRKPMVFVLQLASDSRITFCDMGMLYAFACPECRITASRIQSH